MRNSYLKSAALGTAVAFCLAAIVHAQQPAAAPPTGPGLSAANPTYVSIPLEVSVNKPAAEVWKRVGKFDLPESVTLVVAKPDKQETKTLKLVNFKLSE